MKLPNFEQAIIPEKKLTEYLLSESHIVGRFKASFFRRLGFSKTNTVVLQKEILNIASSQEVLEIVRSDYGTKFIIEGTIGTALGKSAKIRTVWIIEKKKTQPVFVTAHPV